MAMGPALEKILDAKRANPYSDEKSIQELRDEHRAGGAVVPLPEGTEWKIIDAGGVPAEWISCGRMASDRVFMFIHGGGYYRGSAEATRSTAARISSVSGMRCLSINYRLAPENTFPAAIDDTYNAYKWLLSQDVAPKDIVVGGISAGGGLTLALLLKLKETGEPQPAGSVPISAWTDMTQSGETMFTNAESDPVICKAYLDRMAELYLAGKTAETPLASPLFGDLAGLPPMLVQVGSAETMLDDSRRFAEKARAAGVNIDYEVWEDMFHGWHGSAHVLEEAVQAIESIGRFCKKVQGL
ncbi:MAG: Monoterpene epsilon-lactone hydrolase [Alphaproteobacteria bacterium MarineAlpha4_Bin2]|nr:MAG: Monoterpene epsilon-lactone hydrolase [Alphaproteobacteria bacterium MarineAlpha4_Bin2]